VKALVAHTEKGPFKFDTIQRQAVGSNDVSIKIKYCGVCHSDMSAWKNEWQAVPYPLVPGHEIVGIVDQVGDQVTSFKVGDRAAVGCLVDSCRTCPSCTATPAEENYCYNGASFTFGFPDLRGVHRYGGYSERIILPERYALHLSEEVDLAATAPLLCAGITTYTPLKDYFRAGAKVGIVGIGGLGHVAIKLARALGYEVTAFTSNANKRDTILKLGANQVIVTSEPDAFTAHAATLDLILDTISGPHDLISYSSTLKPKGRYHIVGLVGDTLKVGLGMIIRGLSFSGSCVGSIPGTQEMLDLCAKNKITADVELVHLQDIATVYERLDKGDVRYRFVLDIEKDLETASF